MQCDVYRIFPGQYSTYLDVQMLISSKMNDICLKSLPVMIWNALLKQYSLMDFTIHTGYIFKLIPENLREISCDLDLMKFNFNC
jgi:hypothetical protein